MTRKHDQSQKVVWVREFLSVQCVHIYFWIEHYPRVVIRRSRRTICRDTTERIRIFIIIIAVVVIIIIAFLVILRIFVQYPSFVPLRYACLVHHYYYILYY